MNPNQINPIKNTSPEDIAQATHALILGIAEAAGLEVVSLQQESPEQDSSNQ